MDSISLADAEGRLSELIDRVQAGEEIEILSDGKAVARLSAARSEPKGSQQPRKAIDFDALRRFTDSLPKSKTTAADLVRTMRDDGY